MSKYSSEFKLKVIEYYHQNHSGVQVVARHFNVASSCVQRWIKKYQQHGTQGLLKNQIKYDGFFKKNVIEYMHKNHLSLNETAIYFNLAGDYIVGKWERIYYEEGPQALFEERRGRRKIMSSKPSKNKLHKNIEEDLISENQRLRMENAYLKKLQALVQERVARESQTKHKPSAN